MSEYTSYKYEQDISTFFVVLLFLLGGYFAFTRILKINPLTKELDPGAYGRQCGKIVGTCNDITAISCRADHGGPLYYVNNKTGVMLGRCGGDCLNGVCDPNTCPPRLWTCKKVKY